MPILYRNVLDGLRTEFEQDVWLWAAERPGMDPMCYGADKFLGEVMQLIAVLTPIMDFGTKQILAIKTPTIAAYAKLLGDNKHDPDLMAFILKRHANWRFGRNVSPPYASN